jgi:hypothetical protein
MRPSFHEDLNREDRVEGSSDRAFGLTVGGILLLICAWRLWFYGLGWIIGTLGGIGLALVIMGLVAPARLAPLNRAWIRLGLLLATVVSPIVLGLMYVTTIVPMGLIMRAFGRDPLRLKLDPAADSYWVEREPGPAPETMTNQF